MTYSPKKNIKMNFLVSLLMLLLFVSVYLLVDALSLPTVIWQSVFFVFAVVFCELMSKYFLPVYTYCLSDENFVITKTLGRKTITVCNIDNDRIAALYSKDEYKKQERFSPKSMYNYNGNMFLRSCSVLIFEYSNCCEAVVFEPDAKMADAILCQTKSQ